MSRYIDADALLYDLEIVPLTGDGGVDANDLDDIITRQPTADVVEMKHGEWEVIDASEPRRYGCSNCKILSWDTYNYCPNCGADMRKEVKE